MNEKQQNYLITVENFVELTVEEVEERLAKGEETILYIGKPVCPYCQKFVPKLNNVREQNDLTVHYLNSIETETNPALKALRNKMGVPLVPQVVTVNGENDFTNLEIDSGASEETLTELLVK